MDSAANASEICAYTTQSGLRKVVPYWYPHRTMAKQRWWGRELLEVVSTEFRERSTAYYRHALESGVTTINGACAAPDTIVRNGDLLENVTHRHEPPVTAAPVRIVHRDPARSFIVVDKPGSIPVHATGRFFKNTMVEVLRDQGEHPVYTVNRLDRLTSGLLILPTTATAARALTDEFVRGEVHKEYVARCIGEFPKEEVICEQLLLTVDRQMGLNIVHPAGKHAKTIFRRMRYDAESDTSVVHCSPITGRSHQIRVHLQFLGHPIANDTLYRDPHIWGASLGRGGLDTTPSDIRAAPAAPSHLDSGAEVGDSSLPRETGHDIGSGSPVPLSAEAVGVITRLRALKDADEGWARWRDTAFRGRGALRPSTVVRGPDVTERARREEGKKAAKKRAKKAQAVGTDDTTLPPKVSGVDTAPPPDEPVPARTTAQVMAVYAHIPAQPPTAGDDGTAPLPETARAAPFVDELEPTLMLEDATYCAECFLPLPPDPTLDKLYIFLHALRYTSALGTFATDLPEWAAADFTWAGYVPVVPR